ncbi:MAG: hypothetical protein ACOCZE_03220, partial [Planctomycetota bacterium]
RYGAKPGKAARIAAGNRAAIWQQTLLAESKRRPRGWALTQGRAPTVELDGDTLRIGQRSYLLKDRSIVLP